MSNSSYDTSATLLIKKLKWLTVTDMIKNETATVTYKAITGLTPSYLSNLFIKSTDRNIDINLRNGANDLYIPRVTASKGQEAISFRCAKTCNKLSSDIKEANSLNSFKCKLKHHCSLLFECNVSFHSPVSILLLFIFYHMYFRFTLR